MFTMITEARKMSLTFSSCTFNIARCVKYLYLTSVHAGFCGVWQLQNTCRFNQSFCQTAVRNSASAIHGVMLGTF